jgi:hypothetical protein
MWAVAMQSSITAVTTKIKLIVALIKTTEDLTSKNLRIICNDVSSSQLPPSASCQEAGICSITKVSPLFLPKFWSFFLRFDSLLQNRSSSCINLSGNTKSTIVTTGQKKLLIHPSLLHFFTMVWYVNKVEHVIRNYTRWWLEQRTDAGENMEELCNEFARNDTLFSSMHVLFNHAVSHITQLIDAHRD